MSMLEHRAMLAIVILASLALPLGGQGTRGATIAGTVRDSSGQPIPDAEVVIRPGNNRTRTDSAGRFLMTGLDDGGYAVAARKIGYALERWDVKLSKDGRVNIPFVLRRQLQLDTIVVTAARQCPEYTLDAFFCHRRAGGALFLDYPDIDELSETSRATFTADLFRHIPGFRVTLVSSRRGLDPVAVPARIGGCISSFVDGHPASSTNAIPVHTRDLSGIEVYMKPDSVPPEYRRYTWRTDRRPGRCSVVLYWTIWVPLAR